MLKKASRASSNDLVNLKGGASLRTPHLAFSYRLAKEGEGSKVAISVAKKVAKQAVDRNRLKRQIRVAVKDLLPALKNPCLILIRVMNKDVTFSEIQSEVQETLEKL